MSSSLNVSISGKLLYLFSEIVRKTYQFRISGLENLRPAQESKKPVILTSWHGMTMMVLGLIHKQMDVSKFSVIVPDDERGDVLSVFASRLGVEPIKVNLSGDPTFGAGRRLLRLLKRIKGGNNFLIHPDGPSGPAYKVKPGLSFIAQKTGVPILPLGCYCRKAYHVNRWDRYTLPLPFSKINIQLGSLITIPADLQDLRQINREIEDILNGLTFQASATYYLD